MLINNGKCNLSKLFIGSNIKVLVNIIPNIIEKNFDLYLFNIILENKLPK